MGHLYIGCSLKELLKIAFLNSLKFNAISVRVCSKCYMGLLFGFERAV